MEVIIVSPLGEAGERPVIVQRGVVVCDERQNFSISAWKEMDQNPAVLQKVRCLRKLLLAC